MDNSGKLSTAHHFLKVSQDEYQWNQIQLTKCVGFIHLMYPIWRSSVALLFFPLEESFAFFVLTCLFVSLPS